MKRLRITLLAIAVSITSLSAHAVLVEIDLSTAVSGNLIVVPEASFGGYFDGQSQTGNTISGTPNAGLSLIAAQSQLTVAAWNPNCAGCDAGNSILPQPSNQAPLAIRLGSAADSFELVMGSAQPPSNIRIDFFDAGGNLVAAILQNLVGGYNKYSYSGLGTFSGISFHSTNDGAGLRYMDMAYNSVAVPEPGTLALLGAGVLGMGITRLRRRRTDQA